MKYDDIAVLIPAYKPDRRLNKLVDDLLAAGFKRVVVVDDGGGAAYAPIFADLAGRAQVLTHPVNRGKGAALKTGLTEIKKTPGVSVVTADADGQHTPEDIAKIADALLADPDALILGSRDKKAMPPRSKAGNTLTCCVFGLLTGLWLGDTQTGLRGLPAPALDRFSTLEGDRYEYEINMLISASEHGIPVKEVEIETIYIDNNASSHFNALRDGLKIYRLMFRQAGKFVLSSLISSLLDVLLFSLAHYALGWSRIGAQIGARVISATVNYLLNSRMVFGKRVSGQSFVRYAALAVVILACSCVGHWLLEKLHVPAILAKIIVDGLLYLVSYRVQRSKVFGS
ncbi:MAG: bifunctional glycosyltransferase family 2/GtrA family protein [Clostridia bacterium]|nr:bifunctional glycosyltransferase family 2/GtrA family protein [Clostridia bacterium]